MKFMLEEECQECGYKGLVVEGPDMAQCAKCGKKHGAMPIGDGLYGNVKAALRKQGYVHKDEILRILGFES